MSVYPAYYNSGSSMRPVTKVRFFGIRLGIVVLAIYWLAIFTGTHLPKMPITFNTVNDKVQHFGAFFGLSMLLCYVTTGGLTLRRFGGVLLVCAVYGAVDEISQGFVRGRSPDLKDFTADMLGATSAIVTYITVRLAYDRYTRSRVTLDAPRWS